MSDSYDDLVISPAADLPIELLTKIFIHLGEDGRAPPAAVLSAGGPANREGENDTRRQTNAESHVRERAEIGKSSRKRNASGGI